MIDQTLNFRKTIRAQRRKVSIYQHRQSEQCIFASIMKNPKFNTSQNIGIYLNAFGEIYTNKIILLCFKHNKNVYLPRICNMNQKLYWVKISAHQFKTKRFSQHQLGMLEPKNSRGIHVNQLDLIFMPLLACDLHGNRMGMGGGFYDRTLVNATHKPFRVGLAHDFQVFEQTFNRQIWDQPIHMLFSPTKILNFKSKHLKLKK